MLLCVGIGCGPTEGEVETGEASTGAASTSEAPTTGAGESTGDGLVGAGGLCGALVCDGTPCDVVCEEGLVCYPEPQEIGCGYFVGRCQTPPTECPEDEGEPVCGCDGALYSSLCHARLAGVQRGPAERCEAPAGAFPCGPRYCALGSEYCEYTLPHGQEETHLCREPPADCSATDCECLPEMPCTNPENIGGWRCELHEGGWLEVICAPY